MCNNSIKVMRILISLIWVLFFCFKGYTQPIATQLAQISIAGRSITKIIGLPEAIIWHLDPDTGSLFLTTTRPCSFFLVDEAQAVYHLFLQPCLQGPNNITLTPKPPKILQQDILDFMHSTHTETFKTTLCNPCDKKCPAYQVTPPSSSHVIIAPDIKLTHNQCTQGYIVPISIIKNIGKRKGAW